MLTRSAVDLSKPCGRVTAEETVTVVLLVSSYFVEHPRHTDHSILPRTFSQ